MNNNNKINSIVNLRVKAYLAKGADLNAKDKGRKGSAMGDYGRACLDRRTAEKGWGTRSH